MVETVTMAATSRPLPGDVKVTLMVALILLSKNTSELLLNGESLTFVIETLIVVSDLAFLPTAGTPRVIFLPFESHWATR